MADQPDYLTPDTYVADPQAMRSSGKSRTLAVVLAVVAGQPVGTPDAGRTIESPHIIQ